MRQVLVWLAAGYAVLVMAILLNMLANALNLATWYKWFQTIAQDGLRVALLSLHWLDIIFLFIVYPLLLGLVAYWILAIIHRT